MRVLTPHLPRSMYSLLLQEFDKVLTVAAIGLHRTRRTTLVIVDVREKLVKKWPQVAIHTSLALRPPICLIPTRSRRTTYFII